jgi:hypothetical protein
MKFTNNRRLGNRRVYDWNDKMSHLCQVVKITPVGIVGHAIFPNEADVVSGIVYSFILPLVELLLDKAEIHGLFDHLGIVEKAQGLPVDWLPKRLLTKY